MQLISVIETFGAAMAAMGGIEGVKWLARRKQEKRKLDAEADKEEVSVEKAIRDMYQESMRNLREENNERTKELRATIADVNLMYHTAIKDGARKDGIIEDKTSKIRELNDIVYKLQQQINNKDNYIASLFRYIDWLKTWHCEREQPLPDMTEEELKESCVRRKPPHKTPMRYVPFDDESLVEHVNMQVQ